MAQAQVVADLVRRGLGDVLGVVAQGLGYHPRRLVEGVAAGGVEHTDVGHATTPAAVAHLGGVGDERPGAEHQVGRPAAGDGRRPRVLGGDVDVERGVVLRHPLPHRLDHVLLGGAERRRAVEGEGFGEEGVEGGAEGAVPGSAGDGLAVEVEVDGAQRPRPAVQTEGVGVGERSRLGLGHRHRLRRVGHPLHVVDPLGRIQAGGGVGQDAPRLLHRLVVGPSHGGHVGSGSGSGGGFGRRRGLGVRRHRLDQEGSQRGHDRDDRAPGSTASHPRHPSPGRKAPSGTCSRHPSSRDAGSSDPSPSSACRPPTVVARGVDRPLSRNRSEVLREKCEVLPRPRLPVCDAPAIDRATTGDSHERLPNPHLFCSPSAASGRGGGAVDLPDPPCSPKPGPRHHHRRHPGRRSRRSAGDGRGSRALRQRTDRRYREIPSRLNPALRGSVPRPLPRATRQRVRDDRGGRAGPHRGPDGPFPGRRLGRRPAVRSRPAAAGPQGGLGSADGSQRFGGYRGAHRACRRHRRPARADPVRAPRTRQERVHRVEICLQVGRPRPVASGLRVASPRLDEGRRGEVLRAVRVTDLPQHLR